MLTSILQLNNKIECLEVSKIKLITLLMDSINFFDCVKKIQMEMTEDYFEPDWT